MGGLHIIESAMGYRGSKSVTDLKMAVHQIKSVAVKEQRVDGSWYFKDFGPTNSRTNWSKGLDRTISQKYLRCTLMGFERSYQTRILSNLINRSFYLLPSGVDTILPNQFNNVKNIICPIMDPWFFTGFVDAEGCFTLGISLIPPNPSVAAGGDAKGGLEGEGTPKGDPRGSPPGVM